MLALSSEPQSTTAWAVGARGERLLGERLDKLIPQHVHALHDRRIPGTKANIDHIVVAPQGVLVIDAKRYRGRPHLQVDRALRRPSTRRLFVGRRDCSALVTGVQKQVELVRAALERATLNEVPVSAMLCFVEADWPLIGGSFTIDGVRVLWPKAAGRALVEPGDVDATRAERLLTELARAFPSA